MSQFPAHLACGFRLLCPSCRNHALFETFLKMYPTCPGCGYVFEREEGYFVGAIYINIIATFAIILGGSGLMAWFFAPALMTQISIWVLFSVLFPVFFFRYSRGVWLNLDHYFSNNAHPPGETGENLPEKNS